MIYIPALPDLTVRSCFNRQSEFGFRGVKFLGWWMSVVHPFIPELWPHLCQSFFVFYYTLANNKSIRQPNQNHDRQCMRSEVINRTFIIISSRRIINQVSLDVPFLWNISFIIYNLTNQPCWTHFHSKPFRTAPDRFLLISWVCHQGSIGSMISGAGLWTASSSCIFLLDLSRCWLMWVYFLVFSFILPHSILFFLVWCLSCQTILMSSTWGLFCLTCTSSLLPSSDGASIKPLYPFYSSCFCLLIPLIKSASCVWVLTLSVVSIIINESRRLHRTALQSLTGDIMIGLFIYFKNIFSFFSPWKC